MHVSELALSNDAAMAVYSVGGDDHRLVFNLGQLRTAFECNLTQLHAVGKTEHA
jgi:hypothetical protein